MQSKPQSTESPSSTSGLNLQHGLVEALTAAYADLIKRQRTASAAFVRWNSSHARAHEFCWIEQQSETIMFSARDLRITPKDPAYQSIRKMMSTIELNPYECELLYGYPYVVGNVDGKIVRGPVVTMPIAISTDGDVLIVHPSEETVRFNSLPFRSDLDTAAHEMALDRLIDATPGFPLTTVDLQTFCKSISREMQIELQADLEGTLKKAPAQPRSSMPLRIVDSAACFVAPKTSYFAASDLSLIGARGMQGRLQKQFSAGA